MKVIILQALTKVLSEILSPLHQKGFKIYETRNTLSLKQSAFLLEKKILVIQRFVHLKNISEELKEIRKHLNQKNNMHLIIPYLYSGEPVLDHKIKTLLVQLSLFEVRSAIVDQVANPPQESIRLILRGIHDLFEEELKERKKIKKKENENLEKLNKIMEKGSYALLQAKRETLPKLRIQYFEEAEQYFTQVIELMGEDEIDGYVRRGDTYFAQKKYSAAMQDYRVVSQKKSTTVEVHAKCGLTLFMLAENYLQVGNRSVSAGLYEKGKEMIEKAEKKSHTSWNKEDRDHHNSMLNNPTPHLLSCIQEVECLDFSGLKKDVTNYNKLGTTYRQNRMFCDSILCYLKILKKQD